MTMRVTRFLQVALGLCFAGVFCCGEINGGGGFGGESGGVNGAPIGGAASEPLLSSTLVLGSGSYAATSRFEGTDASAAGWADKVSGTSLVLGGTTTDPTYGVATPFTVPLAVDFAAGKSFCAPDNTLTNITDANADIVLEYVYKNVAVGVEYAVAGKYASGATGPLVVTSSANGTNFYGPAAFSFAGAINATWYHLMIFVDRNGTTKMYRNAIDAGTSPATAGTSMNTATPFCIGSYNNYASGKSQHQIALVQQWTLAAGSVGSAAESQAVASARYAAAQARGFAP